MKLNDGTNVRPARDRERGQVFVVTACCMLGILAMSAWVVDIGFLFSSYQQLQAATQAAALAGATQMKADYLAGKSSTTAFAVANQYSAYAAGDFNIRGNLNVSNVTTQWLQLNKGGTTGACGTGSAFPDNLPCDVFSNTPGGLTGNGANGIVVGQQATVQMFFAQIFGIKSLTISAYATAVPGRPAPFNMEVILDSTASMNTADALDTICTYTQEQCAKLGFQALLQALAPCGGGSCGTGTAYTEPATGPGIGTAEEGSNVNTPLEEVGLFTFEGLTTDSTTYQTGSSSVPYEYCGSAGTPSIGMYDGVYGATADAGPPAYAGQPYYPPTYEIVPLSSDFQSSPGLLNTASHLVAAAGTSGTGIPAGNPSAIPPATLGSASTTCTGLQAIGGAGTYYAGIISAAQAALVANKRSNTLATCYTAPGGCAQNVIVLLSDGEANAINPHPAGCVAGTAGCSANMIGYPPNCGDAAQELSGSYPCTPSVASFPNDAIPTSATTGECHEAAIAANAAAAAGTDFYAVAYGSETSGCSTDTGSYISPCYAMQQMASSPGTPTADARFFFNTGSDPGCTSINPAGGLSAIFRAIAQELETGRLIPNGST